MEETSRTLAYICPVCRQSIFVERSMFQLAAAGNTIPCPCGKSALKAEVVEGRAKLSVACLFCQETHTVACSAKAFLQEKALAFSCTASGLDCCYVGEKQAVYAAMKRLEEAVDKLECKAGETEVFLDELVMHEVLAEVKEIAQRGGVSCTCGAKGWKIQVNYSSIDLFCADCGAAMRIPAATASDIEDICCKDRLII